MSLSKTCLQSVLRWFPFMYFRAMAPKLGMPIEAYLGARILNPINSSTITVGGRFTNVVLDEKKDVDKFTPEAVIPLIGSNFGEKLAQDFKLPEKKIKTTKRGRKPKPKEPKKRVQGSGKYFNSQITFIVRSPVSATKIYKFKVFRNGKFQVPGVLTKDLSDINQPLEILRDYFRRTFGRMDIEVIDRVVQMRNCKTIISDDNLTFNTDGLGALIESRKAVDQEIAIYSVVYKNAQQNSSKITVKFLRPTPENPTKTTTLKILKQKIDFEGATNFEDVFRIYWWLNNLIIQNYSVCVNDPLRCDAAHDSDSSDTDNGNSDEDEAPPRVLGGASDEKYATDPYDLC